VITKTVDQARAVHRLLADADVEAGLLDHDSTAFVGGIVVTSAHLATGLEFDVVLVPDADDANYSDEMDRCMLYIACTRAMHELHLTHVGARSRLLSSAVDRAG
jgi:DNA helicase II / ATP-dependent DNA helicase PcrA